MKKAFLTVFIFTTISFTVNAQSELLEIKSKLSGNDKTRWIFEKMQKTMGNKSQTTSGCTYSTIIFSAKDSSYLAAKCVTNDADKGKWFIVQKGNEEFTIKLDRVYEIVFYIRTFQGKERRFLRLRIPGKTMSEASIDYHYLQNENMPLLENINEPVKFR